MKMRLFLLLVFVVMICSCGKKITTTGTIWRVDSGPIERDISLLVPIESCVWQKGQKSDYSGRGLPTPEEYYIRGFIQISENVKAQILENYEWQDVEIDVNGLDRPPFGNMYEEFIKNSGFKKSEDFMRAHIKNSSFSEGEIIFNPETNTVYFNINNI